MAVQNTLAARTQKSMAGYLNSPGVLANIDQTLGADNRQRFITGVISAVNANAALKECTQQSVLSGALLGESLKLSPSPQLGHYYLVPYNSNGGKAAQFQMGYKGYIQLAIRSGQYKKINVLAVKQGELEYFDPLNEEIKVNLMIDRWDERENAPTIGYYAMFELVNGFRKAIYWSKKQMEAHAMKYSPGYRKDLEKGWKNTFWSKDFDGMAYKTMLRQLISKWGIMSIDMQSALESDMTFTDSAGKTQYTENDAEIIDIVQEEKTEHSDNSEPAQPGSDARKALFGG